MNRPIPPRRSVFVVFPLCVLCIVCVLRAEQRAFKIGFYNIRSGMGIQPLGRRPATFTETVNCDAKAGAVNAWGAGIVQAALARSITSDATVIALGLAEAWNCGSPKNVRETLGWKADSSERNGVALLAKFGFSGKVEWLELDTSQNKNPRDTMWIVRGAACLDTSCSDSVDVYAAHWSGTGAQASNTYDRQVQQSVQFMQKSAAGHVLVGDLNVFEGPVDVCGQHPNNSTLAYLRRAGYVDAWPTLHGGAEGFTGMINRRGCGVPEGNAWKRIDYAWSKGLTPKAIERFGGVPAGEAAPSDHLGIIAEYSKP